MNLPESEYNESLAWRSLPIRQRCRIVGGAAENLVAAADELIESCASEQRVDPVETITAELMPLAAALKFIRTAGPGVLRERRLGVRGRPAWLPGVHHRIRRAPLGRVLIVGTWNYPLFLTGTQAAQALAAGNTVLLKPAVGSEAATRALVKVFVQAGVPELAVHVLPSDVSAATAAIDAGMDLVVLTGSAATGAAVMKRAAETMTPTVLELSGCDAVVVLSGVDLDRVAACVRFGLGFNSGATCIAPRRIFIADAQADGLLQRLGPPLRELPMMTVHPSARPAAADVIEQTIDAGAHDVLGNVDLTQLRETGRMRPLLLDHVTADMPAARSDVFAPMSSILRSPSTAETVLAINDCPYRLAVSIFGAPREAERLAGELDVGSVSVNDLIVPTADPRIPFGGTGRSGLGVTRGAEGLLSMTRPVVVSTRRGKLMPHLMSRRSADKATLTAMLQLLHGGGLRSRLHAAKRMVRQISSPPDSET